MMLTPSSVHSLSVEKWSGRENVSFAKGSAELTDSSKGRLARHFPRINALELEIIIVSATGDDLESDSNKDGEMSLGLARARSVRQFLIDAGFPSQRIYTEAKLIPVVEKREQFFSSPPLGTVDIEYVGVCKTDDRSICDTDPQAQPIIPPDAAR